MSIAIVYHSGYGHTEKVARAVVEGVSLEGIQAHLIKVDTMMEEDWAVLDAAQAIVFGAPTYMGGVSGPFKNFLDTTSSRWMRGQWNNKIAAGFTNSGSLSGDKLMSLQQMITTAMQHGMIWVGQIEKTPSCEGIEMPSLDDVNRVGSYSGLMTTSNNVSPDIAPPSGDLKTARLFGRRVAQITQRFQ